MVEEPIDFGRKDSTMTTPSAAPTPAELIDIIDQVFQTGVTPTPEEIQKLKDGIEKLTNPGRGSTLDFSDPANSGLISVL